MSNLSNEPSAIELTTKKTNQGRDNQTFDFGSAELGNQTKDQKKLYDPYSNRNVEQPTSFLETIIHLLKASLGTGILAMPCAFKNSGYMVGTIGTVVIGILCTYTIHLLIKSSYELCVKREKPSLTYSACVAAAFEEGPIRTRWLAGYARTLTDAFLVFYQIGSSCIYVVFISDNIKSVVEPYFGININIRWYMTFLVIPLIMITLIKNLKCLAPFSSVATLLAGLSFIIIFYYIFREPLTVDDRPLIGSANTIPLFFGTVLFAMEAIGVVFPLENEMAEPARFDSRYGVLNVAFIPITILYLVVGLFGFLKYGENVKGSITLDIPQNELLSSIVKLSLTFSIYIGYALSNYVALEIVWTNTERRSRVMDSVTRILIVLVTYALAIVVPYLEILISFMGSLCLSTVGIALPAVVNYLTFIESYQKGTWQYYRFILRNLVLVLIGLYALVIGVYQNILEIMRAI